MSSLVSFNGCLYFYSSATQGKWHSTIAADAVGHGRNVLYDQTIARNAGISRLYNQTLLQLSHAALRGTSNASLLALRQRFLSPRQQL